MNLFRLIKLLIKCKFRFTFPKKRKILIYDEVGSDTLISFFKKEDCEIFYNRLEEINIPILLFSILSFEKKKFSTKYVYKYIQHVKPKLIISFVDNKVSYYKLKFFFKNIAIVAIQNGLRPEINKVFKYEKKENLIIDYLFTMNENYTKNYSKLITGNVITIGSIKNNLVPREIKHDKLKRLLFISQYRNPKMYGDDYFKKDIWGQSGDHLGKLMNIKSKLLIMMADYCTRKGVRLEICGRSNKNSEKFFYNSLLNGKIKNWTYHSKVDDKTTYKILDQVSAVTSLDSTLVHEAFARKIPVAVFSARGESYNNVPYYNFGFPNKFSSKGPFWTNNLNKTTLDEMLDLALNVKEEDWKRIYSEYCNQVMIYDEDNKKFKNIMRTLNVPLVDET